MTDSSSRVPRRFKKGALAVAAGLVVASISTYAFQAIAGRSLDPETFGKFASLWSAFFIVVIVAFLAIEQTVTARLSGGGEIPGRHLAVLIIGFAGAGSLVLDVFTYLALKIDAVGVLMFLPIGVLGYGMLYPIRGVMAGQRRFLAYGGLFAAESLVRLVLIILLATFGRITLTTLTGAVTLAPVVVALSTAGTYRVFDWSRSAARVHVFAVGALGFANLALVMVLNMGPVILVWLGNPSDAATLFAGLLLVRSPLYLFQSVTSTALSYFGGLLKDQRPGLVFARVRLWFGGLALVGLLAVIPAAPAAGFAVGLLFGDRLVLGTSDYVLLGIGVVGIIIGLLTNQFFIAAMAELWVAGTWAAGLAVFLGLAVGGGGSLIAVEVALAAAGVTVTGIFLIFGGLTMTHRPIGSAAQQEA